MTILNQSNIASISAFGLFTDDRGRRTRIGEVEWPRAIQEISKD